MMKAYKFRMYPNNEQKELLNKTFGCARYIYNYFLNLKQEEYKKSGKTRNVYEYIKEIPSMYEDKPWLKEVDSCSLRTALFDLEDAYKTMYKKINGYPKYKSKYDKASYRTNCINDNIRLDRSNNTIRLPKIKDVTIKGYRNIESFKVRIINVTISKDKSNRFYVSVVMEEETKDVDEVIDNPKIIGIDLGISELVTTNEGQTYENIKVTEKYSKRIRKVQRELARKEKESSNYRKCKLRLAILHRKISNTRKYYLHEISKKITEENSIIVTETLKIKEMIKNKIMAKSISDVSWYELIKQLGYKSKWKKKELYQIDTYYPSSQECSVCGSRNKKVKNLQIRHWE